MRIDESVSKLEGLEKGFDQCANDLSNIFLSLGLTSSVEVPKDAPQVVKYAASALIINETETLMKEASEPDGIQVVIQLGKMKHSFGERLRLAMPGGALLSNQELNWIDDPINAGVTPPPNLFYQIAKLQLLRTDSDGLTFDYDFDRAGTGFTKSIRSNLLRELSEEISGAAVSRIELKEILDGERVTTLRTMNFGDVDAAKVIAKDFKDRGVTTSEDGTLKGIFTHVTERVAVATGPIHDLPKLAVDNSEAAGVRVMDLRSILEASKRTSESADTWRDYRQHFPHDNYADGIRNPSLPWGLARLASWIKERVLESDTYREGPRLRGTGDQPNV